MEDLSHFITEEIYILEPQTEGVEKASAQALESHSAKTEAPNIVEEPKEGHNRNAASFEIGIVSEELTDVDKDLLNKILGALNVKISDVTMTDEVDSQAKRWLVFDESIAAIEAKTLADQKIIYCLPLSELQENVEYKRELWGLLKNHFDI